MNWLGAIFVAGADADGMLLVCVIGERIFGSDIFGTNLDGTLTERPGGHTVHAELNVPGGVRIVQGVTAPPDGLKYQVNFDLDHSVFKAPYIAISTPFGPVNARFQFLRELEGT